MYIWNKLGIEMTDDISEIKKAYANKSKQVHPEEHPEEFKQLRDAYKRAVKYAKSKKETENVGEDKTNHIIPSEEENKKETYVKLMEDIKSENANNDDSKNIEVELIRKNEYQEERLKTPLERKEQEEKPKTPFERKEQEEKPKTLFERMHPEEKPKTLFERMHPGEKPKTLFERMHPEEKPKTLFERMHPEEKPKTLFERMHPGETPKSLYERMNTEEKSQKEGNKEEDEYIYQNINDNNYNVDAEDEDNDTFNFDEIYKEEVSYILSGKIRDICENPYLRNNVKFWRLYLNNDWNGKFIKDDKAKEQFIEEMCLHKGWFELTLKELEILLGVSLDMVRVKKEKVTVVATERQRQMHEYIMKRVKNEGYGSDLDNDEAIKFYLETYLKIVEDMHLKKIMGWQ